MLQRSAAATRLAWGRAVESLSISSARSAKKAMTSTTAAAKSGNLRPRKIFSAFEMQTRLFSAAAVTATAKKPQKLAPNKTVEDYLTIDVYEERRVLEADLPREAPEKIKAALTEIAEFKSRGKAPPVLLLKKTMYHYYASGDFQRAHLAFLDLAAVEKPTLFDFNLVFVFQSIEKDYKRIHEVRFHYLIAQRRATFFSPSFRFVLLPM